MATNTRGSTARNFTTQMIHYLRASVTFEDDGEVLTVGVIPAGALVLKPISGAMVLTAFDSGTSDVLDIGSSENDDLFATELDISSAGFVAVDEDTLLVTADTTVTATYTSGGTAPTEGSAIVVVAFIVDNDR